ncbi:hypothetical protein pipiens_007125 [Culex pipiens pipiens]|uniref:Thioredoxin domain-containing protein n=1 Tax=Culex pipiens pipiens TaxID=38569 RepID=A0ABD1DMI2_CULPP
MSALAKLFRAPAVSTGIRSICTGAARFDIFKIQSPQEFDEKVKNSKDPIIVDFFATWCGPCRMLTPRIESVIGEQKGKVKLAKVDIDEHSDLALDYEVASVPVLLAIRNGKVEQRLVGLQDTDKLRNWVENVHTPNEISALHGGRFGSTRVECWNEWNEVLEAGNRLRSKESLKLPAVPESKLKATKAKLLAHPENLRRQLQAVKLLRVR